MIKTARQSLEIDCCKWTPRDDTKTIRSLMNPSRWPLGGFLNCRIVVSVLRVSVGKQSGSASIRCHPTWQLIQIPNVNLAESLIERLQLFTLPPLATPPTGVLQSVQPNKFMSKPRHQAAALLEVFMRLQLIVCR